MICRSCGNKELVPFIDLGYSPPSNAYLEKDFLSQPEINYPLRVVHCSKCWLVQTEDYAAAEDMFNQDYAYFSSTSSSSSSKKQQQQPHNQSSNSDLRYRKNTSSSNNSSSTKSSSSSKHNPESQTLLHLKKVMNQEDDAETNV